ncbi:hypothetical protein [Jiangella anatolica]|uniref:hypothetical protein n=1 Tax=Jiangella anatolica TaxID=2670374 RepID=UPI0011B47927|nr:hypothetical protein [Jiangella anatolica]
MSHLVWPAGLALTVLHTVATLPPTVFVPLDVAFIALVVVAVRRSGPLILPAGVLFALASFTGAPTADEPGLMVINGAALLVAGIILLVGFALEAHRLRSPAANVAVALLALGTAGYLANLVARFAIVLAGAAPAQAAVEDRAWQAYEYLRGLDGTPDFVVLLLVWLDLLQVAYVVLAYLAAAMLAVACRRAGELASGPGALLTALGAGLSATVIVAAAAATWDTVGAASAAVAFGLTIPFMSTLLPAVLAAARTPRPNR